MLGLKLNYIDRKKIVNGWTKNINKLETLRWQISMLKILNNNKKKYRPQM